MILHVANLDKFIPPFVVLINQEFDQKKHKFYLYGDTKKYRTQKYDNVTVTEYSGRLNNSLHYLKLVPQLLKAKGIILHGLFDIRLIIILTLMPWVLKKSYWVIWGGDLYKFQKPKRRISEKVKEAFRAFVIKRMGYLVTYIPGDVELAREWYGARGEYRECLMYLSNVVDANLSSPKPTKAAAKDHVNILVGNSADPSNNHFEVLDKLLKYKNDRIKIYVPLSYGNQVHARAVMEYGSKLFGDKFHPVMNFTPLSEYKQFLQMIDIAVFNHKRQQAMGNTITLLGMGKTIYMRSDVTQWDLFKNSEISIRDIEQLDLVHRLDVLEVDKNQQIIKNNFSVDTLILQYKRIFK